MPTPAARMDRIMNKPSYRRSSRGVWLWLGICLLGLAGVAAISIAAGKHPSVSDMNGLLIVSIACLPFFIALTLAVFMDRRITRLRRRGIADRLTSMGYD